MKEKSIVIVIYFLAAPCLPVRLHKLFQHLDGFESEHNHRGFLHIGNEYSVFLHMPNPHDKYLVYELYESQNVNYSSSYKPTLLAVSKIPIEYIKEQLVLYKEELDNARYLNKDTVPGTQVKTLREWQIEKALGFNDGKQSKKQSFLKSLL